MRLAAVALLAALTAAVVLAVGAGSTAPPLSGTITLVGTVTEHHVFTGKQRFPDRESFYLSLASVRRVGKPFGYGILTCGFASTQSTVRQCNGTFSLPRGKIVVAGSFLYTTFFQLALTGGTELYSGVGGNLVARRAATRPVKYNLTFTLR